jgi:tRNA (guanine-N7-)-methyltransferase
VETTTYIRRSLSFARRIGRPLGQKTAEVLASSGSFYLLDPKVPVSLELWDHPNICLEIGFGYGEHLLAEVLASPTTFFIGAEPYMNGVASLIERAVAVGAQNLRIWPEDVWFLLEQAPDQVLDQVFILFPDPWPKKKHHKRRLIGPDNLRKLLPKIKKGGRLVMATDHPDYAQWIQQALEAVDRATEPTETLPTAEVVTRYQRKNLANTDRIWVWECVV